MDRRLLPVLFCIVFMSLACSQIPDQSPSPTRDYEMSVVATLTQRALDNIASPTQTDTPDETPVQEQTIIEEATQPENNREEIVEQEVAPQIHPYIYSLQPGSPVLTANIFHPDLGCEWMGVGGQVLGEGGQPIGMLVIELGGSLNGEQVDGLTLTGSANQWGPGGYEIRISDNPITSTNELWVRVLSIEGEPLSEPVYFNTYTDCEKAAVIINFIYQEDVPSVEKLHFPVIIQEQ